MRFEKGSAEAKAWAEKMKKAREAKKNQSGEGLKSVAKKMVKQTQKDKEDEKLAMKLKGVSSTIKKMKLRGGTLTETERYNEYARNVYNPYYTTEDTKRKMAEMELNAEDPYRKFNLTPKAPRADTDVTRQEKARIQEAKNIADELKRQEDLKKYSMNRTAPLPTISKEAQDQQRERIRKMEEELARQKEARLKKTTQKGWKINKKKGIASIRRAIKSGEMSVGGWLQPGEIPIASLGDYTTQPLLQQDEIEDVLTGGRLRQIDSRFPIFIME